MSITKRKILWGCGCFIIALVGFFALSGGLLIRLLYPSYQLDLMNPTHKNFMEAHIASKFPDSTKWKKGKVKSYPVDFDMACHFTLERKDVDVMFPQEKVVWHENDQAMLSELAKKWLSEETLKDFKTTIIDYTNLNEKSRPHGILEIIVGNNPLQSDYEEVEVFIYYFSI